MMKRKIAKSTLALTFAALLVLALASAQTSSAEPSPSARDLTEAKIQDQLVKVATALEAGRAPADIDGYSGVSLDLEKATLNVYATRPPTKSELRVAAQAPSSIKVAFHQSKYSARQLEDARDRVQASVSSGIGAISVPPQGSSLEVEQTPSGAASRTAGSLESIAGVEVDVSTAEAPQRTSRQNDSSPWFGGAMMFTPDGFTCSSGFGVKKSSTYYLLTAAHCGIGTFVDPTGQTIGTVSSGNNKQLKDTAILQVSGTSGSKYYDGAYNSNVSKSVAATGPSYQNMTLCTSGANSGVHCSVKVNNPNTTVNYGYGYIAPLVRAAVTSGVAVVGGDSGGPAVGPWNGGYTKMTALGIISGGTTSTSCPGMAYPPGYDAAGNLKCYKQVYYAPILQTASDFGITVNTS